MLDGMFTCRGGEDLSGGSLDVRCELGVELRIPAVKIMSSS